MNRAERRRRDRNRIFDAHDITPLRDHDEIERATRREARTLFVLRFLALLGFGVLFYGLVRR